MFTEHYEVPIKRQIAAIAEAPEMKDNLQMTPKTCENNMAQYNRERIRMFDLRDAAII